MYHEERGGSQCKSDIYNYKEKTAVISQILNVTIIVITTLLGQHNFRYHYHQYLVNTTPRHPRTDIISASKPEQYEVSVQVWIIFHFNWHHNEVVAEGRGVGEQKVVGALSFYVWW